MTGHWDMGHKLQLVYGDALLSNGIVKKLNKTIFNIMGQYTCGQASLHFKELSKELHHPTLANKRYQETLGFVPPLLRTKHFFAIYPRFTFC